MEYMENNTIPESKVPQAELYNFKIRYKYTNEFDEDIYIDPSSKIDFNF